ncbi:MAG: enoyl-CoA hydratase [Rhodospirillales bacterium 70-18]|nr:MAG: enoyl-CoA hydratase [Rhodospirillales bacterium 70-18]
MTKQYADGKMLAEVEDGVGLITFNQPEKRNAMSVGMWHGLTDILAEFEADDAVRVVILTGAGHKAFVSGADISQFEQNRADSNAQVEYDKVTSAGRAKLAAFPKPVIARIRGFCLGGGLGIAMQADLRIAAEDSQFGIPAARLGIAYGWDMVSRLVSLVGQAHARTLLFTGERLDSAEAGRIGLVNRVVPDEELNETVLAMARTIADNAPLSVRAAKFAVNQTVRPESERDIASVYAAVAACFDSADYKEGRTAFMEKRRPKFQGR